MSANLMTTQPAVVAYLPMHGPYAQIPEGFGRLYGWIESHGYTAAGMPAAVYFNMPSDETASDAVWELQAPLAGDLPDAPPDEDGIGVRSVPAMDVVSAVHKGPYDSMLPTYQAIWGWIEENGYEPCGPPMERYLNNPEETHPDEALTEVLMPVKKA
ncbi:MAG: GyrI-like domain-containing protein [Coriobacteriia bacterium]|nr:GyrI-like domain-containing protein [Coriobacteriia bacterium]